jgi:hypothetical protein
MFMRLHGRRRLHRLRRRRRLRRLRPLRRRRRLRPLRAEANSCQGRRNRLCHGLRHMLLHVSGLLHCAKCAPPPANKIDCILQRALNRKCKPYTLYKGCLHTDASLHA